jgi:hypothetical protein
MTYRKKKKKANDGFGYEEIYFEALQQHGESQGKKKKNYKVKAMTKYDDL